MPRRSQLVRTPYYFLARRRFREERLVSYIRRQHLLGRHLADIVDDPYVARLGSRELVWETLRDTPLIELLAADIREEFERERRALADMNGPD
jgi:hypothetical protein